jgi:L-aspartate oxidase
VCREGPERVLELVDMGAQFTRDAGGALHLTREGGHTARRIVHATDATGAEIARALAAAVASHTRITVYERHACVDLCVDSEGVCYGVDAIDVRTQQMVRFGAPVTMLASGGAGQLYPSTTNPAVSTGDGIAMAWRANARVANLEFVQFHPTALADPSAVGFRSFLISEAVRGEGGQLRNLGGERFMPAYDSRAELAPRDVVARAIHDQLTRRREPHVLLDISHKPAAETLAYFPTIAARCAALGVDITRDPIPVHPAQHYLCGGVSAGLHGETSIPGLFACGEVAHSGLHGANRLASNSLLEGLVFGARAVEPSLVHAESVRSGRGGGRRAVPMRIVRKPSSKVSAWVEGALTELRSTMWASAGIVRSDEGLRDGLSRMSTLDVEVAVLVAAYGVSRELAELRNLVTCGQLVVASALQRRESRGLHYNVDAPEASAAMCRPTELQLASRPA